MKDAHREKLRQLPRERKLYLLQQNQHIKENRTVDSSLRKSMPTSNSSTSLFPSKALRQKAIKRSETSTRLLFPANSQTRSKQLRNSSSHRSLTSSLITNASAENLKIMNEIPSPVSPHDTDSKSSNSLKKNLSSSSSNKKEKRHTKGGDEETDSLVNQSIEVHAKPPSPSSNRVENQSINLPSKSASMDKRAATYKFSRKNRSKVGSMILEFDALATKLEDTTSDESAAWLLLDNKTLPRNYNMNSTMRSNGVTQHPSVTNLFPTVSTTAASTVAAVATEPSASSSLLSNSYAYQSLTRKDGGHLAALISGSSALDDKRGRDRNSPYYYVERLRSR
jgi:hypothetical protein